MGQREAHNKDSRKVKHQLLHYLKVANDYMLIS
jgi:hypothetical protein